MINRINMYVFFNILKSCTLIFFIFISIAWLLQLTRLFTLTNLIQVDILNVIFLSFYLIPNLISVILPFIIIFGILLCFIKLQKDKEIIAIYSLGMQLKPIKFSLILFSLLLIIFYISLNFYFSPKIYEKYKVKEFDLRNTIDFNQMLTSNFLELNETTTLDFKKSNNIFKDIFISFFDKEENIIYAKEGYIYNEQNQFVFQLNEGFKLSIKDNEIEKLKFANYLLKIDNNKSSEFDNYDRNTLTIFDDIKNQDYINILFKFFDIIFCILIIILFYRNNVLNVNLNLNNNIFFIMLSLLILIINQLIKNLDTDVFVYLSTSIMIIIISFIIVFFKKKYE